MKVISDASALIALARINALNLLQQGADLRNEALVGGSETAGVFH